MANGGGTVNAQTWLPALRREEQATVADEAHRLGRKVTAHCLCAASSDGAVAAGVDHAGSIMDAAGNQGFVPATAERIAK